MNNKKIFTIPNILSMMRIILVPIIAWMYFDKSIHNHYLVALILVFLSAATDVLDGFIARKFNMITDLGKILDPIADKLTQFVVVFCLACDHPLMITVAAIIFAKELMMLIGAVIFVKQGNETPYARWWGKLTTIVLYATILMYILSSFLDTVLPEWLSITAISLCIACLMFSFLNYALVFIESRKNKDVSQLNETK